VKAYYRGYEITADRSKTLAGWGALFLCVVRLSDRRICLEEPYYGDESVREMIACMKRRIDNEHRESDPWLEKGGATDRWNEEHHAKR
jgi:hypothetical protein